MPQPSTEASESTTTGPIGSYQPAPQPPQAYSAQQQNNRQRNNAAPPPPKYNKPTTTLTKVADYQQQVTKTLFEGLDEDDDEDLEEDAHDQSTTDRAEQLLEELDNIITMQPHLHKQLRSRIKVKTMPPIQQPKPPPVPLKHADLGNLHNAVE